MAHGVERPVGEDGRYANCHLAANVCPADQEATGVNVDSLDPFDAENPLHEFRGVLGVGIRRQVNRMSAGTVQVRVTDLVVRHREIGWWLLRSTSSE